MYSSTADTSVLEEFRALKTRLTHSALRRRSESNICKHILKISIFAEQAALLAFRNGTCASKSSTYIKVISVIQITIIDNYGKVF